jgi:hypothetical protein
VFFFLLAIALSVHLPFTASDYAFGIFKLFVVLSPVKENTVNNVKQYMGDVFDLMLF